MRFFNLDEWMVSTLTNFFMIVSSSAIASRTGTWVARPCNVTWLPWANGVDGAGISQWDAAKSRRFGQWRLWGASGAQAFSQVGWTFLKLKLRRRTGSLSYKFLSSKYFTQLFIPPFNKKIVYKNKSSNFRQGWAMIRKFWDASLGFRLQIILFVTRQIQ